MTHITEHVIAALQKATVQTTTMDFITVEDAFPEDFYQSLLDMPVQDTDNIAVEVFNDSRIVKLLYDKFASAPVRSDVIKSIYAFWQQSGCGYSLRPHVDGFPRVFTVIINLAENNNLPHIGTAIYDVNLANNTYTTNTVAPYLRNSFSVIAPHDHTWHGVNLIKETVDRRSIVLVFSAQEWNEDQLHYADWKPGVTVNYGK